MTDYDYLKLAIQAAKTKHGETYRNPQVGAVLVKQQRILAVGRHLGYGQVHAEVNAYQQVVNPAEVCHSTLYVTLEPCCHTGKTPPCAHQIVAWGVKRVVIAQVDPNPLVHGRGIAYLMAHGVQVTTGVAKQEARQLNPAYNFFYEHQRPMVTLKIAQSLDGKIALPGPKRTLLTADDVNQEVNRLRATQQAILIGSGTALKDDPRLLVRDRQLNYPPIRVIVDRRGRLDCNAKVLTNTEAPTWVYTANSQLFSQLRQTHVKVRLANDWTLSQVLTDLARAGVQSVLVEGGAQIQASLVAADLVDQLVIYQISAIFGGQSLSAVQGQVPAKRTEFRLQAVRQIGNAIKITARRRADVYGNR